MEVWVYTPAIFGLFGALLLAVHHFIIHRDSTNPKNEKAQKESCACACFLQLSDISNHETWIIACIVLSVSWALAISLCPC
jgi:hypothetical protein